MKDVFVFIKQGWNNLWKQDIIWLFSALPVFLSVFSFFRHDADSSLLWMLLYLIVSFVLLILSFVSYIGVPYIVYCTLIGKVTTIQDTLFTARKLAWRFIGCSCLVVLLFSPLFFLVLILSFDSSRNTMQVPNSVILMLSPLSLFGATWTFSLAGFFKRDLNIKQTIREAWRLFTSHFWTLAMLGVISSIFFRILYILAGVLTVLIQDGFDTMALNQLNYLNLNQSLGRNILFVALSGILQIIFTPFNDSVFMAAYLKYDDSKMSLEEQE